jgi:hypothetical protein
MRRLWAAVKLALLVAVLGGLIGLGTALGSTALYRWGESQAAAPAWEPRPGPVSAAAGGSVEDPARNHRLLVGLGQARAPLDEQAATASRRT